MSNASDPVRKVALKQAIIEISSAWLQADAHKEHAKDVIAHVAEEYEMEKTLVNQIAKIYHKQNLSEVVAKSENLSDEYESIFGSAE